MTELVTVGGGLPYVLELQTGKVMDILLGIFPTDKTRKQVNDWLYRNSKPGFNTPLGQKADLHLAYGDQRDGHATAHWWKLFYGAPRSGSLRDRRFNRLTIFSHGIVPLFPLLRGHWRI